MILGPKATPQTLVALRVRLGLDQLAPVRYLAWIGGVLRGDWGESLIMQLPVGPLVAQRLGNSAVLALLAWLISSVVGIGLGIVAGLNRNGWLDQIPHRQSRSSDVHATFIPRAFVMLGLRISAP